MYAQMQKCLHVLKGRNIRTCSRNVHTYYSNLELYIVVVIHRAQITDNFQSDRDV